MFQPQGVAEKGHTAISPHQVAALQRLVLARAKFGQADQCRGLITVLLNKPYLIASEQIGRVQQRSVVGRKFDILLALIGRSAYNEDKDSFLPAAALLQPL